MMVGSDGWGDGLGRPPQAAICQPNEKGWRIAPPLLKNAGPGAAVRPRSPWARAGTDYWGRMAVDCSMKSATQSSADISP